jgi:hypothetical protein
MAALARRNLGRLPNVEVEISRFEEWDDRGRRFDALVAASAWHWVDPTVGWAPMLFYVERARWRCWPTWSSAGRGSRRSTQPPPTSTTATARVTATGYPRLEDEVRATDQGWGTIERIEGPGDLFGPPTVRCYPNVPWFDGAGFADLLRSVSIYRTLKRRVREPLLDAIADGSARPWATEYPAAT